MRWLEGIREQPWRITIAAVGGLLVAILIAGLVGILVNQRVEDATSDARYDVELEDEGDDLRAAVLDLRHYHRNIAFAGVSRGGIDDFESAYRRLHEEIDELEAVGVRDPTAPQPDEIRAMATEYYEGFRPAMASTPGPFVTPTIGRWRRRFCGLWSMTAITTECSQRPAMSGRARASARRCDPARAP